MLIVNRKKRFEFSLILISFTLYLFPYTFYPLPFMKFYPEKINNRFQNPRNAGELKDANCVGTSATFVCAAVLRIFLQIDAATKEILAAKFKTNGCGFAIAWADVLTEKIVGRRLTEFHGLNEKLAGEIEAELGEFGEKRRHCLELTLDALQNAFADFRKFQIEEFIGEKALICTCFGVSEEKIEKTISEYALETVEQVGEICNAGTGCGSCQPLIQEIIDTSFDSFN